MIKVRLNGFGYGDQVTDRWLERVREAFQDSNYLNGLRVGWGDREERVWAYDERQKTWRWMKEQSIEILASSFGEAADAEGRIHGLIERLGCQFAVDSVLADGGKSAFAAKIVLTSGLF